MRSHTRWALLGAALGVLATLAARPAAAAPVFARKYGFKCTMCHSSFPRLNDFGQRFRAKFGKDADVYSALGFDSMNVIIEAIRRAGSTDGVAIRNALLTLGDFPLVEGPPGTTAKFDAKGSVSFKIGLAVVRNGKRAWLPFD